MPLFGSAVFTCLVVLFTAGADGQDATGERYVDFVFEPGGFISEDTGFLDWSQVV